MRIARLTSPQQGAALMVMLVIMVVGVAAVLVSSLNSSALNNSRQQNTSYALAQAKDALIGRAASDANLPGSLPCPDAITNIVNASGVPSNIPNDGIADLLVGNDCPSYIGRLPWKTLGLSEQGDGQSESLWYALSPNFRDDNSNHINSDTQGTLNVTGTQTANQLVALIFSAGKPLATQTRSSTATAFCPTTNSILSFSLCANNYLEGSNANLSTALTPNSSYQAGNFDNSVINDQLLFITRAQLMQPVELRIAREAKSCLDNYATVMGNRYPWAVPVQNWYLLGENNTRFGRIPYRKPLNDNKIKDFLAALDSLQSQVNICITNNNNGNALENAGKTLEDAAKALRNAQSPPLSTAVTQPGKQAGDQAQNNNMCDTINNNPSNNIVQTNLNATLAALASELANQIATNNSDQTVRCDALFQSSYWQDWKDLVFYQVDSAYRPGGGGGSAGIQINATGNHRAAVLVARAVLPPKTLPRQRTVLSDYLEMPNAHAGQNPLAPFSGYRSSDAQYQTISNDLVVCLDGGSVNCK